MLITGVVDYQVQDDAHTAGMCFSNESLHVLDSTVWGVDILIVADVVAHVDLQVSTLGTRLRMHRPYLGAVEHGTDPYDINADGANVVKLGDDAVQITNAIAIGVLEAGRVDLVDNTILPPGPLRDSHVRSVNRIRRHGWMK
jgi:hypothetical protein